MASPIKPTDLAILYRQLAALTSAGISPSSAAHSLATVQRTTMEARSHMSMVTRRVMETIQQRTAQGMKLSQAMAEWPQIFPSFHLLVLSEGEMTGQIDLALNRLATITERDIEFHNEIRKISIFPRIFLNLGLPAIFLAFLAHDPGMVPWWSVICLSICFTLLRSAGFLIASMQGQTRPTALKFAMAIPFLSGIAKRISIANFCRTLGMLYGAGVPIGPSLYHAAEASGNPWLAEPVKRIIPAVEGGRPLRDALASTGLFPSYILSVLSTSELTGSLDEQLQRAAVFYENEVERQMKAFCITLGLIMIAVDGIVTTYTVSVVYKKYYENMIENPFSGHTAPF